MSDHVCMCASECAVTWSTPGKAVAATMDTLCTLLPPQDFHTQFRRIKGTNVKKCETMWALALQPLFHSTDSSSKSKPHFHKLKFDTLTVCISFWCEAVKKFTASLPKQAIRIESKRNQDPNFTFGTCQETNTSRAKKKPRLSTCSQNRQSIQSSVLQIYEQDASNAVQQGL